MVAFHSIYQHSVSLLQHFHESAAGGSVNIAEVAPCGSDLIPGVMVRVLASGMTQVNSRPLTHDELDRLLHETFSARVQRVAFVTAESGLEFREIVAVIEIAAKHADYVSLVTPTVEKEKGL